MEEEKSAIELLKDFAKKTGRQINISEKRHPSIGIKGRVFHKNYAIISDKKNHNGYFVNYFDAKQFDDNAKYSGFFFSIDAPSTSKIQIRKKNILNKLNPFFKKNRFTSRYQDFDSQAIITENDLNLTSNIFRNRKFQNLTLKV
ncbi:MAG: hypothetical protein U9R54_06375 [Bacteroidota bacterium]|nr:hypothetical protein [Bacteroidota bacterium]